MRKLKLPVAVGDMVFLETLHAGTVTTVYLAARGNLVDPNGLCAVKTLHLGEFVTERRVQRFIDEARLISLLNHGNVSHVFDAGRAQELIYIAVEYVHGKTLLALLDRLRELRLACPAPIAIHLWRELLDALDYAHRLIDVRTGKPANIVHRELSLENVMVSYEGQLKILDFGAASSALQLVETQAHEVIGELAYMSPEQLAGRDVDARTDVFAATVMLTELLLGVRFFEGDIAGVRRYPSEKGHRPPGYHDLHPDFLAILERGLARDPDARFASAADFSDALAEYQLEHRHRVHDGHVRELIGTLFANEIVAERRRFDLHMLAARRISAQGPSAEGVTQTIEIDVRIATSSTPTLASRSGTGDFPQVAVAASDAEWSSPNPLPRVVGVAVDDASAASVEDGENGFEEDTVQSSPEGFLPPDVAYRIDATSDTRTVSVEATQLEAGHATDPSPVTMSDATGPVPEPITFAPSAAIVDSPEESSPGARLPDRRTTSSKRSED